MPFPSAFSLLAVPARLGGWDRIKLGELLQRPLTIRTPPYLGWSVLANPHTIYSISKALKRRPELVRLGAEVRRWWPTALQALLTHGSDPTTFDRLRFCRMCLLHGDHSPLFQLPWWDGCPVHDEPLCEGCPTCQAPIPAGLPHENPARWLVCSNCGKELSDRALLAHLHPGSERSHSNSTWNRVVAAYQRWLRATDPVRWALPWDVQGEGTFPDVAHLAVRHLLQSAPAPSELTRHLPCMTLTSANARAWSRTFVERLSPPTVHELGFTSPEAMLKAGRRFYAALPISEICHRSLVTAHRRMRRQLKIPLIGHGSPNAIPDSVIYDWRGPRPLPVIAFRLLTGLAAFNRVEGIAYLDFRAVLLLRQQPVIMAQDILARWTGVELRKLRSWPRDLNTLLVEPSLMVGTQTNVASQPRGEPQPRGALGWLYERVIFEVWHDLALECFSRAQPGGILAWKVGSNVDRRQLMASPIDARIDAKAVVEELSHPLLVRARTSRLRPRGWAVAIMQVPGNGPEAYVALLGRATAWPFEAPARSTFEALWTWPEEMAPER